MEVIQNEILQSAEGTSTNFSTVPSNVWLQTQHYGLTEATPSDFSVVKTGSLPNQTGDQLQDNLTPNLQERPITPLRLLDTEPWSKERVTFLDCEVQEPPSAELVAEGTILKKHSITITDLETPTSKTRESDISVLSSLSTTASNAVFINSTPSMLSCGAFTRCQVKKDLQAHDQTALRIQHLNRGYPGRNITEAGSKHSHDTFSCAPLTTLDQNLSEQPLLTDNDPETMPEQNKDPTETVFQSELLQKESKKQESLIPSEVKDLDSTSKASVEEMTTEVEWKFTEAEHDSRGSPVTFWNTNEEITLIIQAKTVEVSKSSLWDDRTIHIHKRMLHESGCDSKQMLSPLADLPLPATVSPETVKIVTMSVEDMTSQDCLKVEPDKVEAPPLTDVISVASVASQELTSMVCQTRASDVQDSLRLSTGTRVSTTYQGCITASEVAPQIPMNAPVPGLPGTNDLAASLNQSSSAQASQFFVEGWSKFPQRSAFPSKRTLHDANNNAFLSEHVEALKRFCLEPETELIHQTLRRPESQRQLLPNANTQPYSSYRGIHQAKQNKGLLQAMLESPRYPMSSVSTSGMPSDLMTSAFSPRLPNAQPRQPPSLSNPVHVRRDYLSSNGTITSSGILTDVNPSSMLSMTVQTRIPQESQNHVIDGLPQTTGTLCSGDTTISLPVANPDLQADDASLLDGLPNYPSRHHNSTSTPKSPAEAISVSSQSALPLPRPKDASYYNLPSNRTWGDSQTSLPYPPPSPTFRDHWPCVAGPNTLPHTCWPCSAPLPRKISGLPPFSSFQLSHPGTGRVPSVPAGMAQVSCGMSRFQVPPSVHQSFHNHAISCICEDFIQPPPPYQDCTGESFALPNQYFVPSSICPQFPEQFCESQPSDVSLPACRNNGLKKVPFRQYLEQFLEERQNTCTSCMTKTRHKKKKDKKKKDKKKKKKKVDVQALPANLTVSGTTASSFLEEPVDY